MVVVVNGFPDIDIDEIERIVKKTHNTWQKGRTVEEKKADTKIGKLAEKMFEDFLSKHCPEIKYWSYDSFRKNNYDKHAPFDGIIVKNDISKDLLRKYARKIISEVSNNKNGKISIGLKKELEENSIYTIEIKSTRVGKRHLKDGNNDEKIIENIIKNDDFIAYPRFKRNAKNTLLNTIDDYIKICNNIKDEKELREIEKENMYSFYIRIYINEKKQKGYLIGYIDKDFYSKNFVFKSMPKHGKSESARYLGLSLKKKISLNKFKIS